MVRISQRNVNNNVPMYFPRRDLSEIVPGASAYGVDINRNFDMNYQASAPSDVDWIEYAGNSSMSEKENLAVEAFFNIIGSGLLNWC